MKILLDYFFPIASIDPTPAASTAFLKQVCVIAKPKSGQEANVGDFFTCTTSAEVAARTDNTDIAQLFAAGMSRVIVLLSSHLDVAAYLEGHESDFWTLLVSSDFSDAEVDQVKASGVATISSYANLVSGTDDAIIVGATTFTAQAGAVVAGDATFRASTDNDTTAASLAAQVNAHAVASTKVLASVVGAAVTFTAVEYGALGNDIVLAYTDNDTNVGAIISSVTGGKLDNGAGLMIGAFEGVVGISSTDDTKNASRAATANYCAFHTTSGNKAKNMFYAFGSLLSNGLNWLNQQYITMPFADDVETLGDAVGYFDDRISFVLSDDEFGEKLAFFVAGGKAITASYIKKNLEVDVQSSFLTYVSGNQPAYTPVQAALLEDEGQKVVDSYISRQWIQAGTCEVKLEAANFVASGYFNISEPNALWRIQGEMRQTL